MKKTISIALVLMLALLSSVWAFADTGTPDYSQWNSQAAYPSDIVNTKYFTAVKELVNKGVISGYDDGLFHPERSVTRAEMAKMLIIITNNTGNMAMYKNNNTFNDLSGYSWAQDYINTAAGLGFIKGDGNGKFNPGGAVTYAEAMTMIVRLLDQVNDSDLPGTWPNNYINYVNTYGRASNITVTDWNAAATRGDIALVLYRNV